MESKMRLLTITIVTFITGFLFWTHFSHAGYFDPNEGWSNITLFDGIKGGSSSWTNTSAEDNEVEPGALAGDAWDLEGFFLNDGTGADTNELALVGSFDLANGENYGGNTYHSGDIFVDTDMDNGYYEYVMDLNFDLNNPGENSTYTVYENTEDNPISFSGPQLPGPEETKNSPWIYTGGGVPITNFENIALKYKTFANDSEVGGEITGNTWHNAAFVNLSFLGGSNSFGLFNTMECANDVISGGGSTSSAVPEPASIFLISSGLLAAFGFRKNHGLFRNRKTS